QAALRTGARRVGVRPAVAVVAQRSDGLFLGQRRFGRDGHVAAPCLIAVVSLCTVDCLCTVVVRARAVLRTLVVSPELSTLSRSRGTCVVQAQSPLTMVASRCTWVPKISANASLSVSHSSGNSSATCDTGQWCWHSWMPCIGPVSGVIGVTVVA